jgi:hypothetical protein
MAYYEPDYSPVGKIGSIPRGLKPAAGKPAHFTAEPPVSGVLASPIFERLGLHVGESLRDSSAAADGSESRDHV